MDIQDLLNQSQEDQNGKPQAPQSPLVSLQRDLRFYKEAIQEVSQDIRDAELSQYPVFIAHQHEVKIGEMILDRVELGRSWSIHASTLEELMEHQLILPSKKEHFIKQYKDPSQFMCLLVMVPQGANFVYYPYKTEPKH
jgi:predicted transcriptional regulator